MLTHDIIDNHNQKLLDYIKTTLPGSQSAKFAVGYFFLSGLEAVADMLTNVQELRLLIGNTSSRQTIEQIAEGYRRLDQINNILEEETYLRRVDRQQRTQDTQQVIGQTVGAMDQTDNAEHLIATLVKLIQEGRLKVKIYTRGRLHAKAYIFDYAPVYDAGGNHISRPEKGIAVVGSSNFSLSGISHNTELNVVVHGNDNHATLTEWFQNLWAEAEPFDEHLMQELRHSWPLAKITPYEIYLKTLYELVCDRLEDESTIEFLWQSEITATLTTFQRNAVKRAVQMIRQYGGCFVSDVVGLGKSYIGAAIVKHFERSEHARPLIICPAPLIEMWEHYNEAYQLNARILSMGFLRTGDDNEQNLLLDEFRYRDRDFVLVDESHNFRNINTQRYKTLQTFLQNGDRRCVLLTATPRNKNAWDIYHQIRLFHSGDITSLPIDPPDLRQYFKLVETGERSLPSLLANILIRRTRHEILRWYGFDAETHKPVDPDNFTPYHLGSRKAYVEVAGCPQFFPKRNLQTIEYSIEATYKGLYEQLKQYLSVSDLSQTTDDEHLKYARYGLWHYVKIAKQRVYPYVELQHAGINLRGLMRISFFKRLESSIYAFTQTLKRMISTHQMFIKAMDQGIVPAGKQAQSILYQADHYNEQDLFDALNGVSEHYKLEDFQADALRNDISHDLHILELMFNLVNSITPTEDAKLQTLICWLKDGSDTYKPLINQKCLIFTQYADTAQYLYDALVKVFPAKTVEVIHSQGENKAQIVGRFAPQANPEHRSNSDLPEIDLLIATDIFSEGLNLQDCDRVINYDLHWNPVRLIQRFGRIDRIGSVHNEIYGFNFLPETELERHLGLQEKLKRRIQEIHNTIGEDAAILDPSEHLNEEAFYAIYRGEGIDRYEEDSEDELVDLNEAEEIIRKLKEEDPVMFNRIVSLRNGVRCGRSFNNGGIIVLCKVDNYRQLYFVDPQGNILSRDIPEILGLLKCNPDATPVPLPTKHNLQVMAVKQHFSNQIQARKAEQKHSISLTQGQRYVIKELRLLLVETEDDDLKTQITLFETTFRSPISEAVRQELNTIRRNAITGANLFSALDQIYHRHNLKNIIAHKTTSGTVDNLPVIVCSQALVTLVS